MHFQSPRLCDPDNWLEREMFTMKTLFHDCVLYSLYIPRIGYCFFWHWNILYYLRHHAWTQVPTISYGKYQILGTQCGCTRLRVTTMILNCQIALRNLCAKRSNCLSLREIVDAINFTTIAHLRRVLCLILFLQILEIWPLFISIT